MSSFHDPEYRARYIEQHGPAAYEAALAKHLAETTVATVRGRAIRTVFSRFGRLFAVGGTDYAHATLEGAMAYAEANPAPSWQAPMSQPNMPKVGDRYVLTRDVERYPHFIARAGMTGTVAAIDGNPADAAVSFSMISLKMDARLDGAEEWDNCVQWFDDEPTTLAAFLADAQPTDQPAPAEPIGPNVGDCERGLCNALAIVKASAHVDETPNQRKARQTAEWWLRAILDQQGCAHMTEDECDRLTDLINVIVVG